CVRELRGMFAFAIWDRTAQTLLLARDRFGIKPLYVAVGPWGIAFASELKALHSADLTSRTLDWEALDMYFQVGYIPAPATPFRDVCKLEPGHTAVWSRARGLPIWRAIDRGGYSPRRARPARAHHLRARRAARGRFRRAHLVAIASGGRVVQGRAHRDRRGRAVRGISPPHRTAGGRTLRALAAPGATGGERPRQPVAGAPRRLPGDRPSQAIRAAEQWIPARSVPRVHYSGPRPEPPRTLYPGRARRRERRGRECAVTRAPSASRRPRRPPRGAVSGLQNV